MLRGTTLTIMVLALTLCAGCGQGAKTSPPADKAGDGGKGTPKDNGGGKKPTDKTPGGSDTMDSAEVATAIEKMGGSVERDKKAKGQPVVGVRATAEKMNNATLKDLVPQLEKLPHLRTLDLSNTKVNDEGLKQLAPLKKLTALDLSNTQVTDNGLEELTQFPDLERLDLNGVGLTGAGLKEVGKLKNLKELSLSDTGISTVKWLTGLEGLTALNVSANAIKDEELKPLAKLKSLQRLDLAGAPITDDGVPYLEKLTNLTQLNLMKTKIGDVRLDQLKKALPKCKIEK